MSRSLNFVFILLLLERTAGYSYKLQQMCGNNTQKTARGCTSQILGHDHDYANLDSCTVEYFPANSPQCHKMIFGPIESIETNKHIGTVSLKPYILPPEKKQFPTNFTVLNITFSNIKWKTMKFRFQLRKNQSNNHCRNIILSNNVAINDQSVLFYDCYWSPTDKNHNGQSHILDFEAADDKVVKRGQYYFNIPSAQMLSPTVTEEEWLPFLYIELSDTNRLHIMPPPPHLNITMYCIKVIKEDDKGSIVEKETYQKLKNKSEEVTFDYAMLNNGTYYFNVTPIHGKCAGSEGLCRTVESPRIVITSDMQTLNICIVSIASVIVATLFIYYIVLRAIRKYCCKDYSLALGNEIPIPPKILVLYPTANYLHDDVSAAFVDYLRYEFGFDIMFYGDINNKNPETWANESFEQATHVLYIVGPAEDKIINQTAYDRSITQSSRFEKLHHLLLSYLQVNWASPDKKAIVNVFFEYSNGKVPDETNKGKRFYLFVDWNKFIAYLSKNLVPQKQILHSEKGREFMNNFNKAKKVLNGLMTLNEINI